MIKENDVVELLEPMPDLGLNAGETGTVLIAYDDENICVAFDEEVHYMEDIKARSVKVVWSSSKHLVHS